MSKQRVTSKGQPMYKVMASIPGYKQGEDQLVEVGIAFGNTEKNNLSVQINTLPLAGWSGRLMIFPMMEFDDKAGGGGSSRGGGGGRPKWGDDDRKGGGGEDTPF